MVCTKVALPGGGTMIVCGPRAPRRRCGWCGNTSTKLCDGPPAPKSRKKTCDKPLCDAHATVIGPERDLCPGCAKPAGPVAIWQPCVGLEVWTARIGSGDPDALDITRGTMGAVKGPGAAFAPTWAILGPALRGRQRARELRAEARKIDERCLGAAKQRSLIPVEQEHPAALEAATALTMEAEDIEARLWAAYAPQYIAEMRALAKANRAPWIALGQRKRVVCECFCNEAPPAHEHCHRFILAGLLQKLGAHYHGELTKVTEAPVQGALFGGG